MLQNKEPNGQQARGQGDILSNLNGGAREGREGAKRRFGIEASEASLLESRDEAKTIQAF